jgi:hypothetical protein
MPAKTSDVPASVKATGKAHDQHDAGHREHDEAEDLADQGVAHPLASVMGARLDREAGKAAQHEDAAAGHGEALQADQDAEDWG